MSFLRSSSVIRRFSSRPKIFCRWLSFCDAIASRMARPSSPRSTRVDCSDALCSASSRIRFSRVLSECSSFPTWCASAEACCCILAIALSSSSRLSRSRRSAAALGPGALPASGSSRAAQESARAALRRSCSASCSASWPCSRCASAAVELRTSEDTIERALATAASRRASARSRASAMDSHAALVSAHAASRAAASAVHSACSRCLWANSSLLASN
mmetsp:Transcript_101610/g.287923  ORF Transcript_101610/g.287923 Transcript_101610/m.287923 type:complete len:217 (-) Transcript_101610:333-983(-)